MSTSLERQLLKIGNGKSYSIIADFFLLFSRSTPWLILHSLRRKGKTLSEISKNLGITQEAIFPELMTLQRKDVLVSLSKSQKTYYRLADDRILLALDLIKKLSQRKIKQAETRSRVHKTSRMSQGRPA